jgi:CheY-like chemotaxis protein
VRILIVDDQPDMLARIADMLAQTGHELVLHGNSKQALTQLQKEAFDVLITDLLMPDVAGADIIRQIRRTSANLWIVAISGGGDDLPVNTMLRISEAYGADRVLYKPFRKPELLAAIARG